MKDRTRIAMLYVMLAFSVAGCSPTAPSPPPPIVVAPPPAPQLLRGLVRDSGGNPLAGVLIASWSGPEAYATSDAKGEFAFTGSFQPGDIFHASKEGYVSVTTPLEGVSLAFVLRRP